MLQFAARSMLVAIAWYVENMQELEQRSKSGILKTSEAAFGLGPETGGLHGLVDYGGVPLELPRPGL